MQYFLKYYALVCVVLLQRAAHRSCQVVTLEVHVLHGLLSKQILPHKVCEAVSHACGQWSLDHTGAVKV